jgi:hypothetical protein
MEYSQELKDTLKELTYTKVWVSTIGEHSFAERADWNEVSREDILGVEAEDEVAESAPKKKKK